MNTLEGFECDNGDSAVISGTESCDTVKCAVIFQMRNAKRRERLSLGAGVEQHVREEKCERILSKY